MNFQTLNKWLHKQTQLIFHYNIRVKRGKVLERAIRHFLISESRLASLKPPIWEVSSKSTMNIPMWRSFLCKIKKRKNENITNLVHLCVLGHPFWSLHWICVPEISTRAVPPSGQSDVFYRLRKCKKFFLPGVLQNSSHSSRFAKLFEFPSHPPNWKDLHFWTEGSKCL